MSAGREMIGGMVESALSGRSMKDLIFKPYGCGEQNIMRMTLPVIAATYLDKTNQWEAVGFDKRNEAIGHMGTGKLTGLKKGTDFSSASPSVTQQTEDV